MAKVSGPQVENIEIVEMASRPVWHPGGCIGASNDVLLRPSNSQGNPRYDIQYELKINSNISVKTQISVNIIQRNTITDSSTASD